MSVLLLWAGASHNSQPPARLAIAGDRSSYTLSGKDSNLNQGAPLWVEIGPKRLMAAMGGRQTQRGPLTFMCVESAGTRREQIQSRTSAAGTRCRAPFLR